VAVILSASIMAALLTKLDQTWQKESSSTIWNETDFKKTNEKQHYSVN
jgi:hypothetical protein